jgi:hypothetical protein
LLLSALDVEKAVRQGYGDVLFDVYNFFDTKLKQMDIKVDKNTFGSSEALDDVFEKIMSSSEVPVAFKGHIRALRLLLKSRELPQAPGRTVAAPPTVPAMRQHSDLHTPKSRLIMAPFLLDVIKKAGFTNALNRVVSYLNENASEILFSDDHFDLKTPLRPFLILLTSPTREINVKQTLSALLQHLKTALSAVAFEVSDGDGTSAMDINASKVHEENHDAQNSTESSLPLKYYEANETDVGSDSAPPEVGGVNSMAEAPEGESASQHRPLSEDNSVWPSAVLKLTQSIFADDYQDAFAILRKRFHNVVSAVQDNLQYTRNTLKQLFNKLLSSDSSDGRLEDKLMPLLHYLSSLKGGRLGKELIQEMSQKMQKWLIENMQNVCSSYRKSWSNPAIMERAVIELLRYMEWPVVREDELENYVRSLLTEYCDVQTSTALEANKSQQSLDSQGISEINDLTTEYDRQIPESSTPTPRFSPGGDQELEEDTEYLRNKYDLSSAKLSQPENSSRYSNAT